LILTRGNEYSVVLDACVLAPMPLCDTLLRCAEEPALFRPLWSEETLQEVSKTLKKFGYSADQATRRIQVMRDFFPEASVVIPPTLLNAVPDIPDPFDKHVIAAAIHERAEVIVTSNLRDFPRSVLEPHEILVQSPDEFLVHQYHLSPDRILEVLDVQASGISQRRQDILGRLQHQLPDFVALINGRQL
jgi:predicted nucleic acid-binding protein